MSVMKFAVLLGAPKDPQRATVLVGLRDNHGLVGDQTEAVDGVPGEGVLTTEVEDTAVAQFHREGDSVTESVVTDEDGAVAVGVSVTSLGDRGGVATAGRVGDVGDSSVLGVAVASTARNLDDLSGLDEDAVVKAADLTEHEVARGGVLRNFDELRVVTELTALVRVNECNVGLAQPGDVLRCEGLDSVLDGRGGEEGRASQFCAAGGGGTSVVPVVDASGGAAVVTEDDRRSCHQGVTSLAVQVESHVAAEKTRGRGHDVVERRVEQELRDRDRVAVLRNRDRELLRSKRVGLQAHAFHELRGSAEVVVTHEVDLQTRGNAKLSLLHSELLEAEDRHALEQNFLRPDGLDCLRQLRVSPRIRSW